MAPAVCLAAGVVASHLLATLPVTMLVLAASLGFLACFTSRLQRLLWCLCWLAAGWASLSWRETVWSADDLRALVGRNTETVAIRGVLLESPLILPAPSDPEGAWRSSVRMRVREIRLLQQPWRAARGEIVARTTGVVPEHFYRGQFAEIEGVLRPPPAPTVPGGFDLRRHLRWRGIHHLLSVRSPQAWKLPAASEPPRRAGTDALVLGKPPLAERFLVWAQEAMAVGLPVEDEALRLQWAMVLGWKPGLNDEVAEPFMRSGTMHIFAISGLHVAMIAGILLALLGFVPLPRGARGLVVIPLIWFYTGATGWQPSAIRAAIMATVLIAGYALTRPSNLLNSLFGAALIILLWDPRQLFQASFQLSFLVVLSIALLSPAFEFWRRHLLEWDPLLPKDLRPDWRIWLDKPLYHLTTSMMTSLAAFLGSLPLIAQYFNLVTPASLLANLLIVPLSGMALACGLGALFTFPLVPMVTELFNHCGWLLMTWMVQLSQLAADLPAGYFHVNPPGPAFIGVYWTGLAAVLSGWLFRARWRWVAGLPTLAFALWFSWGLFGEVPAQGPCLHVLTGGGGHVLLYANRQQADKNILIDSGSPETAEWMVKPLLRYQRLKRVPLLLLTHGDYSQIGGAKVILNNFSPEAVVASPLPSRSKPAQETMRAVRAATPAWIEVLSGDQVGPFTLLHPEPNDRYSRADDGVIVSRAIINGTRVLHLSDLGRQGQSDLLARHPQSDLQADIVIAGMPSQGEPLAGPLLAAIRPKLIILADCLFPTTARAGPALRERLGDLGIPVVYGHEQGAITIEFQPHRWRVRTMRGLVLNGGENH